MISHRNHTESIAKKSSKACASSTRTFTSTKSVHTLKKKNRCTDINLWCNPPPGPVYEDKINELPTPQRDAAIEFAKSAPSRRESIDPFRLAFDEVLVETDRAKPGERVVIADAFVRRPFFSKYAGHVGESIKPPAW
jgi:hypothetical protein